MADLKSQIEITADATGVEAGVVKAKRSLADLGAAAQATGWQGSEGFGSIGAASGDAAARLGRSGQAIVKSIEQTIASFDAGGKAGSQYFETIARQKGVDPAALKPYLDALDAASAKSQAAVSSKGIDAQVAKLQQLQAVQGLSSREAQLHKLALEGASKAQLDAADSAIKLSEAYERGQRIGDAIKTTLLSVASAAALGAAAFYAGVTRVSEQIGAYKDLSDRIGDSAEAVASMQTASDVSGQSLDQVASFSVKLTKALSQTDDESKRVGQGLKAIGLNFETFKQQAPVEQIESIAKALKGFDDGSGKTAALESIARGASALLPFLNDLGDQQERQVGLTNEQIDRADEFAKAHARQVSALKALTQSIVVESLPAITDLIGSTKDVIASMAGISGSASDLSRNRSIADFADNAALALARVLDVGASVGRFFNDIGSTIGVVAAAIAATARGEFAVAKNIIAEAISDAKGAKESLSFVEAMQQRIAQRGSIAAAATATAAGKAKINTSGLVTDKAARSKKADTSIDKAQLAYDIDDIQKQFDRLNGTYKNSETVLEAMHSAGMVGDAEYFGAKRDLIRAEADADAMRLQGQIDRYQQEKLTGKDAIDNARKIADARSKIESLGQDTTTKLQVLSIQQEESAKRLSLSFLTARQAAQEYFDTAQRQQARDLAGAGLGTQSRQLQAGVNQIEDRYATQRREAENLREQLESENKFDDKARAQYENRLALITEFQSKSIDSYRDYYARLIDQQHDFNLGAQEALQNYFDGARNVAKQTEDLTGKALSGLEDQFVQLATTGKASFGDLAKSVASDVIRMTVKGGIADVGKGLGLVGGEGGTPDQPARSASLLDSIGNLFTGKKAQGSAVPAVDTSQVSASFSTLQTAGIEPTTAALQRLQEAAAAASGGFAQGNVSPVPSLTGFDMGKSGEASTAELFKAGAAASGDAAASSVDLALAATSAANDIGSFARAASNGSGALQLIPGIVASIQAASLASSSGASTGGGGGGLFGSLIGAAVSYFGGGGLSIDTSGVGAESEFSTSGAEIRGRRAEGGSVAPGRTYEVNERGPEILETGGKQFLMMGAQGGNIVPNGGGSNQRPVNVTINQSFASNTSRQTMSQAAAQAAAALRRAQRDA